MAGYYRSCCKNLSTVVHPLIDLLSPSRAFMWSLESQQAFESIKSLLCSAPVPSALKPSLQFKLEVDASTFGVEAVLQEDANGVDHPICYFSKKINPNFIVLPLLLSSQCVSYAVMRYEIIAGQINYNLHLIIKVT